MKKQLFLTLSALLTLSGCGGGGAASYECQIYCPGVYVAPPPSPPTVAQIQEMALQQIDDGFSKHPEESAQALSKTREMTPRRGSVIQSTNVKDDTNITRDLFSTSISEDDEGYLIWEITYDADPEDESAEKGSTVIDTSPDGVPYAFNRTLGLHNIFGDLNLPNGSINFHLFSDYGRYSDYSVGGLYWYLPNDEGRIIFGAFADGNRPAAAANLTTSARASYKGEMRGVYWRSSPSHFTADTLLTVVFGDNPSIAGGFENIKIAGDDIAGRVDLQSAPISIAEDDGGFFTGELGGTIDGRPHIGKWGGQFYGELDEPARVIGTAAGGPRTDGLQPYYSNFITSYWAYQESFVIIGDPDEVIAKAEAAFIDALPEDTANYGHTNFQTVRDSQPAKRFQQSTNNKEGSDDHPFDDEVTASVSGSLDQPQFEVRYKRLLQVGTNEPEAVINADREAVYSYSKDGVNYQRVIINSPADPSIVDTTGRFHALVYSNYDGEGDTDYFAGGTWLYVPDDFNYERAGFGAFMDGTTLTVSISERKEEATYSGEMLGFYTDHTRQNGPLSFSSLSGNTTLNVNFGSKTISGAFTEIEATNKEGEKKTLGNVDLGSAKLGSDGFFSGLLSANFEGLSVNGYYGGQFYGTDEPSWVAGTAAGGSSVISGRDVYFSAIYAAKKQVKKQAEE